MFANWLMLQLENQYPQQSMDSIEVHDAIIVLGGGLRIPLPPAQHSQLGSSSDRYWYAAQLFHAGKAPKIILSGGNVYPQAGFEGEADYAKRLLVRWGVPPEAIEFESNSRNTQQNRDYTAALLANQQIASALLVTSASHMPRAVRLFENLPVMLTPASADIVVRQVDKPDIFNWIPSAGAMQQTTRALHEYYGMLVMAIKRYISN